MLHDRFSHTHWHHPVSDRPAKRSVCDFTAPRHNQLPYVPVKLSWKVSLGLGEMGQSRSDTDAGTWGLLVTRARAVAVTHKNTPHLIRVLFDLWRLIPTRHNCTHTWLISGAHLPRAWQHQHQHEDFDIALRTLLSEYWASWGVVSVSVVITR